MSWLLSVLRRHFVLMVSIVGIVGSFSYLAFALLSDSASHNSGHTLNGTKIGSAHLVNIEHTTKILREGDAKDPSKLKINSEFVDPDFNCDFCTQVNYTPGKEMTGAIAYEVAKVDLTGSKRIVFFARGQEGGEWISIVAVGKNIGQDSTVFYDSKKDIFPRVAFALMTKNITLSDDWRRYEINLEGIELSDVTVPFGFQIAKNKSDSNQVFYLKGVTFDNGSVRQSVPTAYLG